MLFRLPAQDYAAAAALFAGLEHELIVRAVLAGAAPGVVYVDNPARPAAAFMDSPEGQFVGGDPAAPGFVPGLRAYLDAAIGPAAELVLFLNHSAWEATLPALVPGRQIVPIERFQYVYQSSQGQPQAPLPPGYALAPIDAALLARSDLELPEHIGRWITSNWADQASYLARGFGAAALHGSTVVSWSLADCVVDGRAEIGIHTAPEQRGRGLAAATAAAAVGIGLGHGLSEIGWQCNQRNVASWRTAERVGFARMRSYTMYYFPPPAPGPIP